MNKFICALILVILTFGLPNAQTINLSEQCDCSNPEILVSQEGFPNIIRTDNQGGGATNSLEYSNTFTLSEPSMVHIDFSMNFQSIRYSNNNFITDGGARILGGYFELSGNGVSDSVWDTDFFTTTRADAAFGTLRVGEDKFYFLQPGTYTVDLYSQLYGEDWSVRSNVNYSGDEYIRVTAFPTN